MPIVQPLMDLPIFLIFFLVLDIVQDAQLSCGRARANFGVECEVCYHVQPAAAIEACCLFAGGGFSYTRVSKP